MFVYSAFVNSVLIGNFVYDELINYMMCLCAFIPLWVFFMMFWQLSTVFSDSVADNESNWAEWGWTLIPTALIGILCFFNTICMSADLPIRIDTILKAVGRQWYWSYEIIGAGDGEYDSIMCDFIDSVDKPLRVNLYDFYQVLVTSSDVIHSFAIPSLNVKVDAIPGRVNQSVFYADHIGIFVGYCSELCGAGHAYMPIVMECGLPHNKPLNWIPYTERIFLLR